MQIDAVLTSPSVASTRRVGETPGATRMCANTHNEIPR